MSTSPPKKRPKISGRFQEQWINLFKGMIVASKIGPEYAQCTICSRDIKVAASGVFDVRMHLGTSMHQSNETKAKTYKPMTSFFGAKPHTSAAVTKAEVMFCNFVAEHNLAASVSDHFTDLVKTMFADSAVAKSFHQDHPGIVFVSLSLSLCFPGGSVTYRILLSHYNVCCVLAKLTNVSKPGVVSDNR